jgi:hypothetical protein
MWPTATPSGAEFAGQHCPVFPPKTGIFSKKNREAIEHERANH